MNRGPGGAGGVGPSGLLDEPGHLVLGEAFGGGVVRVDAGPVEVLERVYSVASRLIA